MKIDNYIFYLASLVAKTPKATLTGSRAKFCGSLAGGKPPPHNFFVASPWQFRLEFLTRLFLVKERIEVYIFLLPAWNEKRKNRTKPILGGGPNPFGGGKLSPDKLARRD
jgi:hypothetical protein